MTSFFDFLFSTVSSSALVFGGIYLARHFITVRLTKSVQHEFDTKLEDVKSRLRISEETFKADLVRKQADIQANLGRQQADIVALQSGAIQSRLSRLIALDKRRLEAVDQLWGAVHDLGFAKGIAATIVTLRWDVVSTEVSTNPRLREMFAGFKVDPNKAAEPIRLAQLARPFITPVAWAYYAAYQAILMHAVGFVKMLELGFDPQRFMDDKSLVSLIKAALPHCSEYIDRHGPSAAYYLVEQLESNLLNELQNMLDGSVADIAEVEKASQILVAVGRVNQNTNSPSALGVQAV
jgi:hypothetical protein